MICDPLIKEGAAISSKVFDDPKNFELKPIGNKFLKGITFSVFKTEKLSEDFSLSNSNKRGVELTFREMNPSSRPFSLSYVSEENILSK